MSGFLCLQGGAEFGDACRAMDTEVLERAAAARPGPVVVVALAPAPGYEHDTTLVEAIDYYSSLGATDVVGAPDARIDPARARELTAGASLVVLPGGSPLRLLTSLVDTGLDGVLRDVLAAGGAVSGASAGAMVVCATTFVPGDDLRLADGLGLVPRALVLPHYSGNRGWLDGVERELDPAVTVLGLPEQSGLIVDGPEFSHVRAVGAEPTQLLGARTELLPLGATAHL